MFHYHILTVFYAQMNRHLTFQTVTEFYSLSKGEKNVSISRRYRFSMNLSWHHRAAQPTSDSTVVVADLNTA